MTRLFLAIELPEDVLAELGQAVLPLLEECHELGWVGADKRHLTLKFFGDVDPSRVPEITGAMDRVAVRHRPFVMELGGVGAFPTFRRARVLWIGVEQEARLELL